jgi:hypothetical protein
MPRVNCAVSCTTFREKLQSLISEHEQWKLWEFCLKARELQRYDFNALYYQEIVCLLAFSRQITDSRTTTKIQLISPLMKVIHSFYILAI